MPLNTCVRRGKKEVPMTWDYFTLSAMYSVCIAEQAPDTKLESGKTMGELVAEGFICDFSNVAIYYLDIDCDLVRTGSQVLKNDYSFDTGFPERSPVTFKAGDVLSAYRD